VTPSRSAGSVAAILDLAQSSTSSIAFLSPWSNRQSDKVLYLRAGADDFIAEPFNPREFRARMDVLLRRSGRRLTTRDSGFSSISARELTALLSAPEETEQLRSQTLLSVDDANEVTYHPEFLDRLNRNIQTVTKFETGFAVYWIKAESDDADLNKALAQLCRQEDILCHNRNGEFVTILTGTDADGVRGFERRLEEKIGDRLVKGRLHRGYQLYSPGEAVEGHA
jgi:response regulator RpfG family c-di-GMP phosphodiesterase